MKSARQSTTPESKAHNPQKPTRLSLSLACFFALSSMVITPELMEANPAISFDNKGTGGGFSWTTANDLTCKTGGRNGCTLGILDVKLSDDERPFRLGLEDSSVDNFTYTGINQANQNRWYNITMGTTTITSATIDGYIMSQFNGNSGANTIGTISISAKRAAFDVSGNGTIRIGTLNQFGSDRFLSESVIQDKSAIIIDRLNQSGGAVYQKGGSVGSATITSGHYYQGYGPNGTSYGATGSGGKIDNVNLQGGAFSQYNGTLTTLNQSGGQATQNGGTITNLNLSGGTFTYNGGTLTNIVLKGGGSGAIFNNKSNNAIAKIIQEYGEHTIYGKITDFTLQGGTVTNNGEITNLTATDTTSNKYITNNNKIGKLTLESQTSITNSASGTIDTLIVNKGNSTINTLTGVAQNPTSKLSSIAIKQGAASLRVDTLGVGLNGNTAIKRVEINNSDGQGTNTEFAVNTVQINYINGTFDPSKPISNQLKDYVTNGSEKYLVQEEVAFKPSPELEGIGIEFGSDGTPHFDLDHSIAASTTSVLIRQSMRRKMLIDTYLAEQSRRSLKNKERRTKQRVEAVVLADANKQYQKDLAKYKQDKEKWDKLASSKENKALIAKYEQEDKAYQKALKQYEKDKAKYDKENQKLAQANKASKALVAPIAPKAPTKPNLKPNHKDYKKAMAAYNKEQSSYQAALKQYELDKKAYDEQSKKLASKPAPIAPIEPKAPTKPNLKPNHKDYKRLMAAYDKAQQEHKKALAQYQKDKAQYDKDKAKYDKENQKLAQANKASKALVEPKEPSKPTKPAILASKPVMPLEPKLGEVSAELLAKHQVQGDFFIRAYGGVGSHKATNGAQTSSWSVGTLLGANWDLKLGQTSGNIGFYGGYEYLYNGYKQAHIDAQGHTGFLGLRFSHLFTRTKLASFYYLADINGGYSDISVGQDMNAMRFSANVGNINFGSSLRLGSSVYMYGSKSILFPSLGVGVEGGYIGEFEMRTQRSGELRYGGLSQGYAVTYAQANLNYYQEYGRVVSTTLGGGFRYLFNTDINIMPTLNGKAYTIDETTGRAAAVHLAPFFYQGTAMINFHTEKAGNFSAGYVVVGGLLGITHNASMRWHYFF